MAQFEIPASQASIDKTISALQLHGFLPELIADRQAALQRIKELIPDNSSIMNGASRTLEEIGFIDYLRQGQHRWNNLHEAILAEKDPAKQATLRKQAVLADYYLGSVHAVTENGELVIASNTGSQLPYLVYTSPNLILVIGTQKITGDIATGLARLQEYVFPMEDQRMKDAGAKGSYISKLLIFNKEQQFTGRKVHILLVNEKLGF